MKSKELLADADHMSLNDFANFLERTADQVREQAIANAVRPEEQQAGALEFLMRSSRIVNRHLRTGCTLDEALEKTAKDTGAPLGSIKRAWRRFCNDKSLYELRRRNRIIIELAAMGFSNADIAKKVNMHPNSISRIIAAARRTYHQARMAKPNRDLILNGGMITNENTTIF